MKTTASLLERKLVLKVCKLQEQSSHLLICLSYFKSCVYWRTRPSKDRGAPTFTESGIVMKGINVGVL